MFRVPWHRLLPRHQRVTLFWIPAGLGVAAPWLLGDTVRLPAAKQAACVVNSIHDGDTLRATCTGEALKIRLYCIDAPEIAQRPWGPESRDHLRRITASQMGLVERDKDRYGRIVGEISAPAGEMSINLAMVEAGQAAAYPRYCQDPAFYAAEPRAREAGRGIWEKEGAQQPWTARR